MGHNHDEYKHDIITLNEIFEQAVKKSYLLDEFGLLEFDIIWIPSKVNYYNRLLFENEAKKSQDDENIYILDNMIRCMEGK